MGNLVDDYREAIRGVHGDKVADNLDVQIKDGWYYVTFNELPVSSGDNSARYRKTQLQTTIANLRLKAQGSSA
ncbi:MAG: hypothetical protein FD167_3393 [bacterium]|nr:MAG: hypothetical protein FD167_3393 [bacterium]